MTADLGRWKAGGVETSLGDEAYARIKQDIVLCRLGPGEEMSEAQLQRAYGLGKASVRKALTRLVHEGLVRAENRRGHVVAPLSLADIREVFLLRRQLEPFAARLAAGRIDEPTLRRLDAACSAGYTPGDEEGEIAFLDANRNFHMAIARATGSPRLAQWLEHLHNEATRILYLGFRLGDRSQEWTHGHETLLDALTKPDPAAAERIARDLLEHSEEQVMQAAMNSPRLMQVQLI